MGSPDEKPDHRDAKSGPQLNVFLQKGKVQLYFFESPNRHPPNDVEESKKVRNKWIYVFRFRKGGTSALAAEIHVDGEGDLTLVDWKKDKPAGEDPRAATASRDIFRVDYEPNSSLWMCLSQIQLPWARLSQYIGNDPGARALVRARCQKILQFNPGWHKHLPEGTLIDANTSSTITRRPLFASQPDIEPIYFVYLLDPIAIARELQKDYKKQLRDYIGLQAEANAQGKKLLLAHLAQQTATAYRNKQPYDEEDLPYNRQDLDDYVEGYEKLDWFRERREDVAGYKAKWMNRSLYVETRNDYMFDEEHKKKCLANEAYVLDETYLSKAGMDFLNNQIHDEDGWYFRNFLGIYRRKGEEATFRRPAGGDKTDDGDYAVIITNLGVALAKLDPAKATRFFRRSMTGWLGQSIPMGHPDAVLLDAKAYADQPGFPSKEEFTEKDLGDGAAVAKKVVDVLDNTAKAVEEAPAIGKKTRGIVGRIRRGAVSPLLAPLALINLFISTSSLIEASSVGDAILGSMSVGAAMADALALLQGALSTAASVTGSLLGIAVGIWMTVESAREGKTGQMRGWIAVTLGSVVGLVALKASTAMAVAGWTAVGAFFVLAGIAIVIWTTDDPYEEWFEHCEWGNDSGGKSIDEQLEGLLRLIGRPGIRVEMDMPRTSPPRVHTKLIVEPLFFIRGQTKMDVDFDVIWKKSSREDKRYEKGVKEEAFSHRLALPGQVEGVTDGDSPKVTATVADPVRDLKPWHDVWVQSCKVEIKYMDGLEQLDYDYSYDHLPGGTLHRPYWDEK